MNTRSAAAIVAVMFAVPFAVARAQNFIPRGPELNFVKPGASVLPCVQNAIFLNAVRGSPLCDAAASGGESQTSGNSGSFLDERGHSGKYRTLNEEAVDHGKNSDDWQKGRPDHPNDRGNWRNGRADDNPKDGGVWQGGAADAPDAGLRFADPTLASVELAPLFDPTVVTSAPEPGSFVLMATGLLGVVAFRRRRTKGREGINN